MTSADELRERLRKPLERELQAGCRDSLVVGGLEKLVATVGRPFADVRGLIAGYAELDPPGFVEQAARLRDRLAAAGRPPEVAALAGHNHMSEIYSLGTEDGSASAPLLAFVAAR